MKVGIDFETYLIGNGSIFPKPVCLSTYDGKTPRLYKRKEAEQVLAQLLKHDTIIAHNAVFECGVIIKHYPLLAQAVFKALEEGRIKCTKINESLWNIQREQKLNKLTLADLVLHYFKKDISSTKTEDSWRLRYHELDDVPLAEWPKDAIDYSLDDSIYAYNIHHKQTPINDTLTLKSAVYLNLIGSEGFAIEQSRVLQLEKEIWEYLTPHYDTLVEAGFCIFKAGKPRKAMKALREHIEALNIVVKYTAKQNIETSAEALESYLGQVNDPVLKAFAEIAQYEKVLTAYISRLKGADKIYSQYSTTKSTSRTSSSTSTLFDSINIQQIPRAVPNVTYDVRNCFKPRPGFVICSIDYSGLELCATAHQLYKTLKYSKMLDMLNAGDKPTDMHSMLASKIKGISYEEFMSKKSEYKDLRQKAKPINLGFPGGIGYDTMRHLMWRDGIQTVFKVLETASKKSELMYYLTNLCRSDLRIRRSGKKEYSLVQDELVQLKRYMFNLYPELEEFLKDTHKKYLTGKSKWVKNDFDEWEEEPLYMYDIYGFKRDNCTYTAFCNGYLMQTPSAIGAQKAMNKLYTTFYGSTDIYLQAFIHDEVIFEVKPDRIDLVERAAQILIEEMRTILDTVRISVEASVSDYWQKQDGFWTQQYWSK